MDLVHEVLGRSAFVSLTATAIALAVGVLLGTWLALGRRGGRGVLATAVNTGMAVPTVVVGLVAAAGRRPARQPGADLHLCVDIIAQVLIAAPLITGITMAGLQAPRPSSLISSALGANRLQLVYRLWVEARVLLLAAAMAGFARHLGGRLHDHRHGQHPRPDAGHDHVHRRAGG